MNIPKVAPYGSWKSPITSDLIVTVPGGLGKILLDGQDLYWIESLPSEGGRVTLVRRTPDGVITNMTPSPFNVRSRVHEYGGGSFIISEGIIYFSNFLDQRLYRHVPGSEPQPLTPPVAMRYADGTIDQQHNRIICVREDHTITGEEAINTLVSVALDGNDVDRGSTVLVSGNDFYASPRMSPNSTQLAWLTWNHPNMPWDGTELWVGKITSDGTLEQSQCVAGGKEESIFQPEWSPDGVLHFVSDRTGWWNLYRWQEGKVQPLHIMEAEFGTPQWNFAMSMYTFASSETIICCYIQQGITHLAQLNTQTGQFSEISTPYTSLWCPLVLAPQHIIFGGASATKAPTIVQLDTASGEIELIRSTNIELDPAYLSIPESIEFPTECNRTAYGFFYPPCNPDYVAPEDELPPLLVISHGGPTGSASNMLQLNIQYWTSRGIALFDVNYGGSSGYGRAYRERLAGNWGIVDVQDCVNGAKYLAEQGLVDGHRLIIRGGSAGGYTTLCALTFYDTFKAGASYYGISDMEALAKDTHKFEARYGDKLVGPYPERRDIYIERSPIHFTDRLSCPVIFFQGLDDKVVPPNQAEMMVQVLRTKGLPVAYLSFEGEGHGFRKAENIKRSLDAELHFYSRIFGFPLADPMEAVEIANL